MNIEKQIEAAFEALNEYDRQRENGVEENENIASAILAIIASGINKEEIRPLIDLAKKDNLWGIRTSFGRLVRIRAIIEK